MSESANSKVNLILKFIWVAVMTIGVAQADTIKLAWEADTNGQVLAECGFKVYQSTNITIPLTNWNVLTNIVATNAQIGGTNFQCALQVSPGQMFYAVTMTNFWGESDFSNTTQTPALPTNPKLKISH